VAPSIWRRRGGAWRGNASLSDIFKFWARIKLGERIHPSDRSVFRRMNPERHGFKLRCLPGCFSGPLRTAPVVLLYLSPGYNKRDETDARKKSVQERYRRRRNGREPLSDSDSPGAKWIRSRTKVFGDYAQVRKNIAVLNIGAYHSETMQSYGSMLALPSSRVVLDWAQNHLFPQALQGKRIVICMRSAAYWGLEVGKKYRGSLFVPKTTRNGYLNQKDATQREIIKLVCRCIGTQPRLKEAKRDGR
jgi:hypothetical protein